MIQNETGDAGLVQRRDIALVVAGRDDLQIAGQLGGADSPERRNGQTPDVTSGVVLFSSSMNRMASPGDGFRHIRWRHE